MNISKLMPLLLVAGCTAVGPDYKRPDIALIPAFVGGQKSPLTEVRSRVWWRDYHNALLNNLIARGLKQNLDVADARERIREAEANLRATGINAAIDGSGTVSRLRSAGDGTRPTSTTTSDLSASLVIDMFGGIRREREAANANLSAAKDDLEKTRLAWLADIIAAYADARYYQEATALTQESINSRVQTVSITKNKYDAGAATEYELAEAQALLDAARADLPQYRAEFNANVFAIAALLNEAADPIMAQMQKGAAQLRTPGKVPTGVPADLLRNRPDVRYYEGLLHAAVADVGVATADMLPSLTLTGDITVAAGANTWSYGPELSLPLLNQGLLSAQRDAKISQAKQAEIDWRSAVASAVKDVQVAQSNLVQYRARSGALQKSAASYSRAFSLAQQNYRGGAVTLLDLLDTDRSTASAKISAASAANETAKEWATLQIAIGAGASIDND
ncbi:efflux transporter outer membrane subunit [Rhizobium rhizogenes]|uniref:efflux transporter outer membrane subunit n=1 Tax=Rhizobium rhizogenes TaxID=359 RepID=UPI00157379A0|nr:efflux transporter outer membrane subunit [Rhizobium rhizogenes]NTI78539.1 efflux transporter outer membrane subunit [Rhizobium rhizogenes]